MPADIIWSGTYTLPGCPEEQNHMQRALAEYLVAAAAKMSKILL